jgi:hypothetical protein
MNEFVQNQQLTVEEGVLGAVALDGAACYAPALTTGSSTPPTPESSDSPETQGSIHRVTDSTDASPLTVKIESGPAKDVNGPQPNDVRTPKKLLPPPSENGSEMSELHTQIKRMIAGRTSLPDNVSAMVAFWAFSTWFEEAFPVLPRLVITGPAHEAMVVLRVLRDLCRTPTLLAGFRRADLKDLNGRTLLISEPNLDNRTAALLGNLTNRDFVLL